MLFVNIVLFTFEITIGLLSMVVLNHLHIQGAHRNSVVPLTQFLYYNPVLFLTPLLFGLAIALYLRCRSTGKCDPALHLTRIAVTILFFIVITLIALLPFVKMHALLAYPANA